MIMNRFHSDILNLGLIKKPEKYIAALCQQHDPVLRSILHKYALVSTKTPPKKPPTLWMTLEIMKRKALRHNIERAGRRSSPYLDRSRY